MSSCDNPTGFHETFVSFFLTPPLRSEGPVAPPTYLVATKILVTQSPPGPPCRGTSLDEVRPAVLIPFLPRSGRVGTESRWGRSGTNDPFSFYRVNRETLSSLPSCRPVRLFTFLVLVKQPFLLWWSVGSVVPFLSGTVLSVLPGGVRDWGVVLPATSQSGP